MKVAIFDTGTHPTPIFKEWGVGLSDLDHEVDFYPVQQYSLLSCVGIPYDLILYAGSANLSDLETVRKSQTNCKIVCAADTFRPSYEQFIDLVDFFITTQSSSPSLIKDFNSIGFKIYNIPLAGNDHLFYPTKQTKEYDVCFIGTLGHGYRGEDKYLYPLLDNPSYNCYLAGMSYRNYRIPFLPYDQANSVRNRTKVNINFHVDYQHEGRGYPLDRIDLNQSVYNIALSGGFQICDHELANKLFDGSIILGDVSNWQELVDYYVNNESAREDLAEKSYKIAIEKHTWKVRMSEFLLILNNHGDSSLHN